MSDKSEAFDRAFSKDDPTMATLKRILSAFDLDIYVEGNPILFDGITYTVRLWDNGGIVARSSGTDLENVLLEIDKSAAAIANYG